MQMHNLICKSAPYAHDICVILQGLATLVDVVAHVPFGDGSR
jgi:hypothetical protein